MAYPAYKEVRVKKKIIIDITIAGYPAMHGRNGKSISGLLVGVSHRLELRTCICLGYCFPHKMDWHYVKDTLLPESALRFQANKEN
jgi:hypothetical protein